MTIVNSRWPLLEILRVLRFFVDAFLSQKYPLHPRTHCWSAQFVWRKQSRCEENIDVDIWFLGESFNARTVLTS